MQTYYIGYVFLKKVEDEWVVDREEGMQTDYGKGKDKKDCIENFISKMKDFQYRIYSIDDEKEIYEDDFSPYTDAIYDSITRKTNWNLV